MFSNRLQQFYDSLDSLVKLDFSSNHLTSYVKDLSSDMTQSERAKKIKLRLYQDYGLDPRIHAHALHRIIAESIDNRLRIHKKLMELHSVIMPSNVKPQHLLFIHQNLLPLRRRKDVAEDILVIYPVSTSTVEKIVQ